MELDPKAWYWTAAWINMAVVVAMARTGIGLIRAGEVAAHRRRMLTALWLVAGFLVSYGAKLALLGREDLASWQPVFLYLLRVHETCIAVMVVAGLTAVTLAVRLRLAAARDGSASDIPLEKIPARLRLHRRAGKTAYWASVAGFLTAAVVLFGMWQRALAT